MATASLPSRPPTTPRVYSNAPRPKLTSTVKVYVVSSGKVRDIEPAFPEWILVKFSYQANYELLTARPDRKVFRIQGPVADNAVSTVLGWMKANAKKDTTTPLNPQNLDIHQLLTVYHVADMLKLKPVPMELRDRIWDHVATTPLPFGMFTIIMGGLGHVVNLVNLLKRKTAEHWIDGKLDHEKELYLGYTAVHSGLEIELEKEVTNRILFLKRAHRRGELTYAPVHKSWREEMFQDAIEEQESLDVSAVTFTPTKSLSQIDISKGTNRIIDTPEEQRARRDSARAGYTELGEDDIENLMQRGSSELPITSKYKGNSSKDKGTIEGHDVGRMADQEE
jgi:hypothetical protein